jgi:hypothetical protein
MIPLVTGSTLSAIPLRVSVMVRVNPAGPDTTPEVTAIHGAIFEYDAPVDRINPSGSTESDEGSVP